MILNKSLLRPSIICFLCFIYSEKKSGDCSCSNWNLKYSALVPHHHLWYSNRHSWNLLKNHWQKKTTWIWTENRADHETLVDRLLWIQDINLFQVHVLTLDFFHSSVIILSCNFEPLHLFPFAMVKCFLIQVFEALGIKKKNAYNNWNYHLSEQLITNHRIAGTGRDLQLFQGTGICPSGKISKSIL